MLFCKSIKLQLDVGTGCPYSIWHEATATNRDLFSSTCLLYAYILSGTLQGWVYMDSQGQNLFIFDTTTHKTFYIFSSHSSCCDHMKTYIFYGNNASALERIIT